MTGSLVVALLLSIGGAVFQGWAYGFIFVAALSGCLMWAMYKSWCQEHQARTAAEEKLRRDDPFAQQQLAIVRDNLATLTDAEKKLLHLMLMSGGQLEAELQEYVKSHELVLAANASPEVGNYLSWKSGFVERTHEGRWYIKRDIWAALKELLVPTP